MPAAAVAGSYHGAMATTLPAAFYVDHETYERERASVFGREWVILGRTAELADTGGYIAEEIACVRITLEEPRI